MTISTRSRSLSLFAALGAACALGAPATSAANAAKVLHAFQGGSDGALPGGAVIADKVGNLFGVTEVGGTGTGCNGGGGCGTLFKIAKGGGESVLYSFQGGTNDGVSPHGSLLMDSSGNIYGATEAGVGTGCAGFGCGAVFKFAPGGSETVLYAFQGGSDGYFPEGSLIADQSGNLYGVTDEGGYYSGSDCANYGCGTVFEVQPNGTKNSLYAFQGGNDGAAPVGGLVADGAGNLYGTTVGGGGSDCGGYGCGTVFKLTPGGVESVLYAFQGSTDGIAPEGGLILDASGNLYGTTDLGGMSGNGMVFEISPTGHETVLYSFKGGRDGSDPEAGLIRDSAGNLYGTTWVGGQNKDCEEVANGCGTVFKLAPDGTETVLYLFKYTHGNPPDGAFPAAPLLMGKNGKLYGTAWRGDKYNDGVVFEVKK